jgi:cytochrome bd ubiquinol oxidase subunit I
MDAIILACTQFAANLAFHLLFPAISIALGWLALYCRLRWLASRNAGGLGRANSGPRPSH